MSECLSCDKFNDLADENEIILLKYNNLQQECNFLKFKYDRYDQICYDFGLLGFVIGVIMASGIMFCILNF